MMEPVKRVSGVGANPDEGRVGYDFYKIVWNLGMLTASLIFAPLYFSLSALLIFIVLTYVLLLVGHSAGMHRLVIHRTYDCPKWLERCLVYLGVLVGMAGPYGIIKIHDYRDWAQRQTSCHDFFSHRQSYWQDLWWHLTCRFHFKYPPKFTIEGKFLNDPFYQFLEKTWRWHQLLLALILYAIGGWTFVIWGVCVRVAVSVIGHWTITYFCHKPGPGQWKVKSACVQASNIPGLGLLTYGECWHNNHHAFPESAKIGLEKGQKDPAWSFIKLLSTWGLVYNIRLPRGQDLREDLIHDNEEM